jgi:excisionase family DNA binding protein
MNEHTFNQRLGTAQDNEAGGNAVADKTPSRTEGREMSGHRLAYSTREAAELLGVSEKTIRRLVVRGLLRSSKALRHLLIPKKEIERFLDETSRQ